MDAVTQAIEWSQIRLEIQGKKLDSAQLEILNFAFQNIREKLNQLNEHLNIENTCEHKDLHSLGSVFICRKCNTEFTF
jgi:hypothetical protein